MDLNVNADTITSIGGGATGLVALLKTFYTDWCARQDKRDMQKRLDEQDDEIASHAVLDAQTFTTRDEFNSMKLYLDTKFSHIETLVISVIKDGAKSEEYRNRDN